MADRCTHDDAVFETLPIGEAAEAGSIPSCDIPGSPTGRPPVLTAIGLLIGGLFALALPAAPESASRWIHALWTWVSSYRDPFAELVEVVALAAVWLGVMLLAARLARRPVWRIVVVVVFSLGTIGLVPRLDHVVDLGQVVEIRAPHQLRYEQEGAITATLTSDRARCEGSPPFEAIAGAGTVWLGLSGVGFDIEPYDARPFAPDGRLAWTIKAHQRGRPQEEQAERLLNIELTTRTDPGTPHELWLPCAKPIPIHVFHRSVSLELSDLLASKRSLIRVSIRSQPPQPPSS